MAESELAILTNQCLNRRIPDKSTLEPEVAAFVRSEPSRTCLSGVATRTRVERLR